MARILIPLLLVIAVGAVLYFVVGGGVGGGDDADGVERDPYEEWSPAELGGTGRPRPLRDRRPKRPEAGAGTGREPVEQEGVRRVLRGRVVADETGVGLAGVELFWVPSREPCPRLDVRRRFAPWQEGKTKEDGTFAIATAPSIGKDVEGARGSSFDVFALAPGRVVGVACAVTHDQDIEIRLAKGLQLEGRVLDPRGRPVKAAVVWARPGPETPAKPGHGTISTRPKTNEEGRFVLDGLLPGDLLIHVDHPHFMPLEVGLFDPKHAPDVELRLQPALRAIFELRTDDGRKPEHPTLIWDTGERDAEPNAVLLGCPKADEQLERGESIACEAVRLPADAKSLTLRVKADGYATWSSPAIRPPTQGGERKFEVTLTGDLATGSIRISLEDELAQPVHVSAANVQTRLMALDPDAKPSAFVIEPGADLLITSLPTGSYRVLLSSIAFAPLETEVVVNAGQESVTKLRTSPPAKVRVRFFANVSTLVRFRLMQQGREVVAIPETTAQTAIDEQTGKPVLAAGSDGLVLSGLSAGTYTIEVLSKELSAPATLVHLKEGDITDVDIQVSQR